MIIRKVSLRTLTVVHSTKREKTKVQMGSASLYSSSSCKHTHSTASLHTSVTDGRDRI